ncbi:MAG: ABC-type transporter, integral rane subunit [Bacteroidetes bacterium]|jgi:peptide/nickel transport system permease protein|nr:ABC-type transporter, integral rane subunit [Bacteroidota bacterium]
MLGYIVKRIFIFIPTLIVITLLGFIISINAPGDPVERMVSSSQSGGDIGTQSLSQIQDKIFWRKKLGLDLPVFYVSLTSLSRPDTLYRIFDKNEREAMDRLIDRHGNWQEIQQYSNSLNQFYNSLMLFSPDSNEIKKHNTNEVLENMNQLKYEVLALKSSHEPVIIDAKFKKINTILSIYPFFDPFRSPFNSVIVDYNKIPAASTKWKNYIPRLAFYGTQNQYHRWLFGDGGQFSKGLIRLDFGTSYTTKQPVSDVIFSKIGWSMFFALLSVILAYLVSIPIGVKASAKRGSRFDRTSSVILFMLYSMPSFWLATLLLMTFANTDVFPWFPASGVKPATGYPDDAGLFEKIKLSLPYLILPAICYTYSSFAFLSRTMRVSMIETLGQDYIRTARAKGLPENKVIWKHAFRNSLLPIITVFANIFPAAIGGSVIIESIFTIPGMGFETFLGIQSNNYPMIIAVFTITGFLTLVGYLISDILYAIADPRISYK